MEKQTRSIDDLKLKQVKKIYVPKKKKGKKRLSRSLYGDIILVVVLLGFAIFSAYPLVFTIANAFKPLDEIFLFPPKLFPRKWTGSNFRDLFNLIGNTRIPMSRFLLNTIVITLLGAFGHVFLAAMCAYPLAKHKFPGKSLINQLIIYSLMFSPIVTTIPVYLIVAKIGLLDTPWAIIIPAWGFTLGLFLMRQFMVTIPDEILESAKVDGANEFQIFFRIVMPLVKPAWLTVIILLVQQLWSNSGGTFIYTERLKPLSYALQQIVNAGVSRTGTAAAVAVIMLIVPISVFIISQSRIIDTMAHSGIK